MCNGFCQLICDLLQPFVGVILDRVAVVGEAKGAPDLVGCDAGRLNIRQLTVAFDPV